MNGILIEPKDMNELKFIHDLLERIGVKHSKLDVKELEDIALGMMMLESDSKEDNDLVGEDEVLKLLRS